MNVAIVTEQAQRWAAFEAVLKQNGHQTRYWSGLPELMSALQAGSAVQAVILDDMDNADTLFAASAAIMQHDVRIHQACRWLAADQDFHEAGEGLGLLPAIAESADAQQAEAFLKSIDTVSALMQR